MPDAHSKATYVEAVRRIYVLILVIWIAITILALILQLIKE